MEFSWACLESLGICSPGRSWRLSLAATGCRRLAVVAVDPWTVLASFLPSLACSPLFSGVQQPQSSESTRCLRLSCSSSRSQLLCRLAVAVSCVGFSAVGVSHFLFSFCNCATKKIGLPYRRRHQHQPTATSTTSTPPLGNPFVGVFPLITSQSRNQGSSDWKRSFSQSLFFLILLIFLSLAEFIFLAGPHRSYSSDGSRCVRLFVTAACVSKQLRDIPLLCLCPVSGLSFLLWSHSLLLYTDLKHSLTHLRHSLYTHSLTHAVERNEHTADRPNDTNSVKTIIIFEPSHYLLQLPSQPLFA